MNIIGEQAYEATMPHGYPAVRIHEAMRSVGLPRHVRARA